MFSRSVTDGVATITMDDGKANLFNLAFFHELNDVFDACRDDRAVVLAGREGMFSAGLDMRVMGGRDIDLMALTLHAFGTTMLRVWTEPRPTVAAVTGHAVAGGTFLAMACDHTVAATGDFKWGLVETTIGFSIPQWGLEIAGRNVAANHLDDLILPGRSVGPQEAVQVGFADVACDPEEVIDRARHHAAELAELPRTAYAGTKTRLRGEAAERARRVMDTDVDELLAFH